MEPTENGKAALISGIEADAQAEEAKILEQAKQQAAEKQAYTEKKVEAILTEAREAGQKQADAIRRKAVSAVELIIKRQALRTRETLVRQILEQAQEHLRTLVGRDSTYRPVLVDWIAEAGAGLDVDSARVNASAPERALIDAALLREAADRVQARNGRPVQLTLAEAAPLTGQGVVLTAEDGHMAFNNQVKTRISRKQRAIQTLIYNALFPNQPQEQS